MSGRKHHKKDRGRKDAKAQARRQDFEQPVVGAVRPQPARDTSNFTDGEMAGPDWRRKLREHR